MPLLIGESLIDILEVVYYMLRVSRSVSLIG